MIIALVTLMIIFAIVVCLTFWRSRIRQTGVASIVQNMPKRTRIIGLGSGPCVHDFDFSVLPDSYNLGIAPQCFRYDERILRLCLSKCAVGAVVVHVICPLSFAENQHLSTVRYNIKYANVLSSSEVDVPLLMYWLERLFSLPSFCLALYDFVCARVCAVCGVESKTQIGCPDDLIKEWLLDNPPLKDFRCGDQADMFAKSFSENGNNLKKIIDECSNSGLRYLPVIAPMSESLAANFSTEFLDTFLYDNLYAYGILPDRILDCNYIGRLICDDLYESNGLFLNSSGRKIMMTILESYIEETM